MHALCEILRHMLYLAGAPVKVVGLPGKPGQAEMTTDQVRLLVLR
jgi:hypothetical protein